MVKAPKISVPSGVRDFELSLRDPNLRLPKRLRQCADFLLEHRDAVALATVADVSKRAGVPPSAFVRFCQAMGFSGFSELQKLYRQDFHLVRPDYVSRLGQLYMDEEMSVLASVADEGRKSIERLLETLDAKAFVAAIDTILDANLVHIVGLRNAFPVAAYLSNSMNVMGVQTVLHDGLGGEVTDIPLRNGDILIAVTFAPYCEDTLKLARMAVGKGLSVIGISDFAARGLCGVADHLLIVHETQIGKFCGMSGAATLVAGLSLLVGRALPAKQE